VATVAAAAEAILVATTTATTVVGVMEAVAQGHSSSSSSGPCRGWPQLPWAWTLKTPLAAEAKVTGAVLAEVELLAVVALAVLAAVLLVVE